MVGNLLDDVLDALPADRDWKRCWAWRLRQHELLARPAQPEFDILRALEDPRARHDQRALAERFGRDARAYWKAINYLWADEAIYDKRDAAATAWSKGSKFALTHRGRLLLGRLRQLGLQAIAHRE